MKQEFLFKHRSCCSGVITFQPQLYINMAIVVSAVAEVCLKEVIKNITWSFMGFHIFMHLDQLIECILFQVCQSARLSSCYCLSVHLLACWVSQYFQNIFLVFGSKLVCNSTVCATVVYFGYCYNLYLFPFEIYTYSCDNRCLKILFFSEK